MYYYVIVIKQGKPRREEFILAHHIIHCKKGIIRNNLRIINKKKKSKFGIINCVIKAEYERNLLYPSPPEL